MIIPGVRSFTRLDRFRRVWARARAIARLSRKSLHKRPCFLFWLTVIINLARFLSTQVLVILKKRLLLFIYSFQRVIKATFNTLRELIFAGIKFREFREFWPNSRN